MENNSNLIFCIQSEKNLEIGENTIMLDHEISYLLENFRRITEETALAVYPFFGKDNKHGADEVAVHAMRRELEKLPFTSHIVIGEGEKDNAPMLFSGEVLGKAGMELDLAVDPLECTTNFSRGLPNSMSIIAFSGKEKMEKVPGTYMEQWIAGPQMKREFEPEKGLEYNLGVLSSSLNKKIPELIIVVQDRPRHKELIQDLRKLGAGISLIDSGSLTASIDICMEFGHYDAMIGTFGAPEGLISAILACLTGSEMKLRLRPHDVKFKEQWEARGHSVDSILDKTALVGGEILGISATCISTNIFMKGIEKKGEKYKGQTLTVSRAGYEIHEFTRRN